jgi:Na+/melibiose symporter-like transporter
MKIKSWLKYFVYIILIFVLLSLKEFFNERLEFNYYRILNITYLLFIIFIINVFIGLLLGLEHFIEQIKKDGAWRINFPKLILMGLPSLLFSLVYLLGFIDNQIIQNIYLFFLSMGMNFFTVFQIILGFVVITSFHKNSRKI